MIRNVCLDDIVYINPTFYLNKIRIPEGFRAELRIRSSLALEDLSVEGGNSSTIMLCVLTMFSVL